MKLTTTGTTEYTDYKSNVHTVRHHVILSTAEKQELEDKIVDELYKIFTQAK